MRLPTELVAGDTWTFERAFDLYPSSTFSLAYYFKNSQQSWAIEALEVIANGTGFTLTKTAAVSKDVNPGRYSYQGFAVSIAGPGTTRALIEAGDIIIRPNFAAAGALDDRSFARRALDAIECYLANQSNYQAASFSIEDQAVSKYAPWELEKLRSRYVLLVAREDAQHGGPKPGKSFIRFKHQ